MKKDKPKIVPPKITLPEIKEEKDLGKFKRSGHLTDQMLKYDYPKDKKQLSLFDELNSSIMSAIETEGIQISEIVEGIKLTPSEQKVIDCLSKLLHQKSQNINPKLKTYYSGNQDYEMVQYGSDKNTVAPKLAFTIYELTQEYKGGEHVGGKDLKNVASILRDLDQKKFLVSYIETTKTKDGGRIEKKIEEFKKLIHIVNISKTTFDNKNIEIDKKEETVILLSPIFIRQIDTKFILYPNDINKRTIIAYGSHTISEITFRLRDYLIRELSSKRYNPEIGVNKLHYLLAEKWMKENRRKKVVEYTDKAIDTVKKLGLLESFEIKTAANGESKIIFKLNSKWE